MQQNSQTTQTSPAKSQKARLRVKTCRHLCSGDPVGAFVEFAQDFNDRPDFSGQSTHVGVHAASDWIADRLQDVATLCRTLEYFERPLILPIPASALLDVYMIDACISATAQTRFCNQEISFELTDSALVSHREAAITFMHDFRRKGFRVSVDARKSWQSEIAPHHWLLIDTLRIRANDLEEAERLRAYTKKAAAEGVAIVAEEAYWRDGPHLARQGINYGLSPRADA